MPTRVRHWARVNAGQWEDRNEEVKVSIIMVLILIEDSRKSMLIIDC